MLSLSIEPHAIGFQLRLDAGFDTIATQSALPGSDADGVATRINEAADGWAQRQRAALDTKPAKVGNTQGSHEETTQTKPPEAQPQQMGRAPSKAHASAYGVKPGTTAAQRRDLNAAAVAILNRGAPYSDADKAELRQYSGNGGCGDSLNEFYTRPDVAHAMWDVMRMLDVRGDVLEPSCGTGVFLHEAPEGVHVTGVELDPVSSKIAGILNGNAKVNNASLERFATQDTRRFAAVIGNVPFGLRGSLIKDDKPDLKTAEAYFVDTALDKAQAGGIVGLIVPTGVMDGANQRKLRERMLRKGQFLGAQRMPNTAFEQSNTNVTTDIIWLRKRPDGVAGVLSNEVVTQDTLKALGAWDEEVLSGGYFTGRGAPNIFGTQEAGWRSKAGMGNDITVAGSMHDVADEIAKFAPEVSKELTVADVLAQFQDDAEGRAKVLGASMEVPYADTSKVGDTKTVDGVAYVLQGDPPRWHRVDEVTASAALTQATALAADIDALLTGNANIDRPKLEAAVQAWVKDNGIPAKHKDVLLAAMQDHTLYRLIGAVGKDGTLSDVLRGKVHESATGNFEAAVSSLLNDADSASLAAIVAKTREDEAAVLDQLYASPRYALDPTTQGWSTRDVYLSGELWPKLDAVDAALVGKLDDATRAKLEGQRKDLLEVIAPVSLEEADITTASAFLPTTMLSAFLTWRNAESPMANGWTQKLAPIEVSFAGGLYSITGGNIYGLLQHLGQYLNRTGLRKDDKPQIDALNRAFKDWLCQSDYREEAEQLYNRKFRGFADREFSDEPMAIPGLETEGLKRFQWSGLRWALNRGQGIIAHDVGLGKTALALILVRTMKLNGQAKRPMIVAPKSVLANWYAECEKWFPGARVLTIGGNFERDKDGVLRGKDDSAAERRRKYHDLQQNDYDFIIVSEPSFEELDPDPKTKDEYNDKDFWVQRGDALDNAGDKRTKKIRESWEQARAEQDAGKRTDATYFNELGVDALITDELHHQKNLVGIKSRFGQQPKFLGGGGLSMRALDYNLKARWLLDHNGGKNVYGLTATPTKNSPIEIYSLLSGIAPEAFERLGIRNSEDFLDRFARFENGMAANTAGDIEEALITAGFQNVNELREVMDKYIRRRTAEDVGLVLPKRQDVQHLVQMDAAQQAKYAELRELAEQSGGKDATGDAHIFSIMDKMNKAATDLSLIDPSYDATKSPKYVAAAAEIVKRIGDGGQVVFSDYVEAHEKIAQALVRAGIPREQIGILNAKAASSASARQRISDAFGAGKLKVVIGNTAVMGEGVNLQKHTSDIHHLDLPWEPASMQQRNGRGLRQGNTNEGVRVHTYLAKGSFDGYRLQSIMAKKDWQDALWNGGDAVENLNRPTMTREDMLIMLSDDPDAARAAIEANRAEKTQKLTAQKTETAAQRFAAFQTLKRSYGALKNKATQSAQRLKAKLDHEHAALDADRYFTAKAALDMDEVIVAPSGVLLHTGASFEIPDDGQYVVEGVVPDDGTVKVRRYADASGQSRRVSAGTLKTAKAMHYDAEAERAEIARKAAETPLQITSLKDLYAMPVAAIEGREDKIQAHLWEQAKDYKLGLSGNVPVINKGTGKVEVVPYYDLNSEKHAFVLPGPRGKQQIAEAWADAERSATFSTHLQKIGRSNTKWVASKRYGRLDVKHNPVTGFVNDFNGEPRGYYGAPDSSTVAALHAAFVSEQMHRIRAAKTFSDALQSAAPLGTVKDASRDTGAYVALPRRVLLMLWAKAAKTGALREPRTREQSGDNASYYLGAPHAIRDATVADALLHAARGDGPALRAMVADGLKRATIKDPKRALSVIAEPFNPDRDTLEAMRALAKKAGVLSTPREQAAVGGRLALGPYVGSAERSQTVGEYIEAALARLDRLEQQKEAA